MRVTVVLDPNFVDHDPSRIGDAFWLLESPGNRRLAEKLNASGRFDPNSAVFRGQVSEAAAVEIYPDVDLHHPLWDEIEFIGVQLGPIVADQLSGAEGLTLSRTADGFIATRPKYPNP